MELTATVESSKNYPHPTVENPPVRKETRKKRAGDGEASSSSSTQRRARFGCRRRNPRVSVGAVRRGGGGDVAAIALPLGMSFAAVLAQVPERKDAAEERVSIDHLAVICTSAIRESLSNVFGDKYECFTRNFEKSFMSTLGTLKLIKESSRRQGGFCIRQCNLQSSTPDVALNKHLNTETRGGGGSTSDSASVGCPSEVVFPNITAEELENPFNEVHDNIMTESINSELALHRNTNQLACMSQSTLGSAMNDSVVSTFDKYVTEQTRSNDLKAVELGLTIRKMKLKEAQLALNMDSNHIEKSKLAMGMSKASFKAEKFKNELEDTRLAELLKQCIDLLVAGMLLMSAFLAYGAYVYSYKRIIEATLSCNYSPEVSRSWWIPEPILSFNSGLHFVKCHVQVVSRMLFGFLVILAVAYLLLQRSVAARHSMPITFILLLLGAICGFAGKLCVDSLGGSGYLWLLYWEILCSLHFCANVFTPSLYSILYGPITVSQEKKDSDGFPYWIRRVLFYKVLLLLPLLCGLMPFASHSEWTEHFRQLFKVLLTSGHQKLEF